MILGDQRMREWLKGLLSDYKFPLWQKLNTSPIVSTSPKRLCLFTAMAHFCKQDGRSSRQTPNDFCYICLSLCAMLCIIDHNPHPFPWWQTWLQPNSLDEQYSFRKMEMKHNHKGCWTGPNTWEVALMKNRQSGFFPHLVLTNPMHHFQQWKNICALICWALDCSL